MAGWNASSVTWAAGVSLAGLTAADALLLQDPMLVYLLMVTGIMAAFPALKQVVALCSLVGVHRIVMRHDAISGDFSSFIASVGEGLSITVGGTANIVALMAMLPALRALISFDVGAVVASAAPALPLATLVAVRLLVENKADTDLNELIAGAIQHARGFLKNIRLLTGIAR